MLQEIGKHWRWFVLFGFIALGAVLLTPGPMIDSDAAIAARARTRAELKVVDAAVAQFRDAHARFPSNEESLTGLAQVIDGKGPFLVDAAKLVDPWGSPYLYRLSPQNGYDLYSAGPNRQDDGRANDDVWLGAAR